MTPYQQHRNRWKDCKLCDLCNRRTKVVLGRGVVPCDVLFVGEAPGVSEDTLGTAFIGPAGKLLDKIIEEASGSKLRIAFTNIIACIPKDEYGDKTTEPPKYAVDACHERLIEFVVLCQPQLIVLVGKFAARHFPSTDYAPSIEIVHPAALLRMDVTQQGLQIQRAVVVLADALEGL